MSKLKNPFKKVLENVKGTQYVSSKTFSESGQGIVTGKQQRRS